METRSLEKALFVVYPSWASGVFPVLIAEVGEVLRAEADGLRHGEDEFFDQGFEDEQPGLWVWEGEIESDGEPGENPLDFDGGEYRAASVRDLEDLFGPIEKAPVEKFVSRLFVASRGGDSLPIVVGWSAGYDEFCDLAGAGIALEDNVYHPEPLQLAAGMWVLEGAFNPARCETGDDEAAASRRGEDVFASLLEGRDLRVRALRRADAEWLVSHNNDLFRN